MEKFWMLIFMSVLGGCGDRLMPQEDFQDPAEEQTVDPDKADNSGESPEVNIHLGRVGRDPDGLLPQDAGVSDHEEALVEIVEPDASLEDILPPDSGVNEPDAAQEIIVDDCEPNIELCNDGEDNDCDGLADAKDYVDCPIFESCTKDEECFTHPRSQCSDGEVVEYTNRSCDLAQGICVYSYELQACAEDEICRRGECSAFN